METEDMTMSKHARSRGRQHGAVLYVALVFLVLLALLGIAGTRIAGLQERMSSNYRATNIAFQLAESEVRTKEVEIEAAFRVSGMFFSDQDRCDPNFDPAAWAQQQADLTDPSEIGRSRRIDRCTPGGSLGTGLRPESEKTDHMYQVTAYSPDPSGTSDAAIDTIFIP